MPDLTDPRESRVRPHPRPDFSIARQPARDGDDDLLGPCFVFVLARCRCIKYSELDTPTPIRPRPTRDELGLGFSPRDCLPSSASASASSSWAPDPFVSVRPVPSKRKPKSAGASKTPADGGSVLCRYRVARSPWRAATVDGAQFRPNPNPRPERDETLTFPLVPRRRRIPDGGRDWSSVDVDSTSFDRCARKRIPVPARTTFPSPSPSLVPGRHIRQLRAVPRPCRRRSSARRATLAYTGPPGGVRLLPAPRCGWAWKRRGKTTTDVSALSVRSLRFRSHLFLRGARTYARPGHGSPTAPLARLATFSRVDRVAMTTTLEAVCE